MVAVPYALRAEEAQRLAGREASEFVLNEQLITQVQQQIETQIQDEGLVASEEGTPKALSEAASTSIDKGPER